MGLFSADCTGCNHPQLSVYATNEVNAWMQNGVTIFPDGSLVKGIYDGYGRYERDGGSGEPFEDVVDGTVWHQACWEVAGSPTDFRGVSQPSDDQGYFFDDEGEDNHNMAEPKPLVALSATGIPAAGADESDLPLCMQSGWDPMTPGREAQAKFLDACIAEGVDPREVDPEGFWSGY